MQVAIVGAGLMGGWHARYATRAGAEVVAVVDTDAAAAARFQRAFPDAKAFASLDDCLRAATKPPDVVHVCTGLASHAALAGSALEAGAHVLVEKPAARSRAELEPLLALAERRGLRLCAVHQFAFQRGFLRVLRERGRLGELTHAAYTTHSAGGDGRSPAERRAVLLEILPHPGYLFRSLLGRGIDARAWQLLRFGDDDLELCARCGDVQLAIRISLRARPTRNELTLAGTRATAFVDLFHGFGVVESAPVSRASKAFAPFRHSGLLAAAAAANLVRRGLAWEPAYPGLAELVHRFYRSIEDGTPPPVGAEEMLDSVELIETTARAAGQ